MTNWNACVWKCKKDKPSILLQSGTKGESQVIYTSMISTNGCCESEKKLREAMAKQELIDQNSKEFFDQNSISIE